jgi:hypothetical protein
MCRANPHGGAGARPVRRQDARLGTASPRCSRQDTRGCSVHPGLSCLAQRLSSIHGARPSRRNGTVRFDVVDSGIAVGPASAMAWITSEFLALLVSGRSAFAYRVARKMTSLIALSIKYATTGSRDIRWLVGSLARSGSSRASRRGDPQPNSEDLPRRSAKTPLRRSLAAPADLDSCPEKH